MIMAVMGYMSLILEVIGMDGGVFTCNGRSIFFQLMEQLGCVFVLKALEIVFFVLNSPCWWF